MSGPGLEWLASLPLPAVSREVVADGLALIVIWRVNGLLRGLRDDRTGR